MMVKEEVTNGKLFHLKIGNHIWLFDRVGRKFIDFISNSEKKGFKSLEIIEELMTQRNAAYAWKINKEMVSAASMAAISRQYRNKIAVGKKKKKYTVKKIQSHILLITIDFPYLIHTHSHTLTHKNAADLNG